jgi:hypothetical protein
MYISFKQRDISEEDVLRLEEAASMEWPLTLKTSRSMLMVQEVCSWNINKYAHGICQLLHI